MHCFVTLTAQQNQIALLLPVAVYVGLAICQLRMLSQMVYMMHQHCIMIFAVCFATLAFVVLLFAYGCSQLFPCTVIVKLVYLIGFNQAINFLYCHIIKKDSHSEEWLKMKLSNSLFYYKELLRVMCVNCVMCVTFFDDPLDSSF